jgi:hypothetical protein
LISNVVAAEIGVAYEPHDDVDFSQQSGRSELASMEMAMKAGTVTRGIGFERG